jgi:microcystin-dependent protein
VPLPRIDCGPAPNYGPGTDLRRALWQIDENLTTLEAMVGQGGAVGGFSGDYNDLTNKPALGTAAATASTDYATAAQGALADTALQDAGAFDAAGSAASAQAAAEATAAAALLAHTGSHAPANAQKNSDITKEEIEAKLTGEIVSHTHPGGAGGGSPLDAWPVGSVYIAVDSTDPATRFGGGTWAAFAAGRVLVGLDAGQTEFDTAEETGGAKAVTLTAAQSGLPQHTHLQDAHAHVENSNNATTGGLRGWGAPDTSTSTPAATGYSTASATAVNQNAGPSDAQEAHSNLQPYITVYMWKRTA